VAPIDPNIMKPDPPCGVVVQNTARDPKLYHFKVVELRTHEDTGGSSEVNLLYHFTFPKFVHEENSGTSKNAWDVNINPRQRLYLS